MIRLERFLVREAVLFFSFIVRNFMKKQKDSFQLAKGFL